MTDATTCPPAPCPAAYTADVGLWDIQPKQTFIDHSVPWFVIAAMAKEGYRTLADLADRYQDVATTRTQAPKEYRFEDGQNGFTEGTSTLAAIRLWHAVSAASRQTARNYNALDQDAPHAAAQLVNASQHKVFVGKDHTPVYGMYFDPGYGLH